MRIAIVGAGFAGLSAAKVLREFGHELTVFEKAPDVGGVWSATRRYPGLRTQNGKDTYALSDFPMPRGYPEWPCGAQVQAYLSSYVGAHGLAPSLRLDTEITSARPCGNGWELTHGGTTQTFDHLVVASGVFSDPFIPPFGHTEVLREAGGQLLTVSDLHDLAPARGKHVVVVGYGKSACDIAEQVSTIAASTTIVARELLWKMPVKIKGILNYKYVLLTRLSEALFRYHTLTGFEKFLHVGGDGIRRRLLSTLEAVTTRQLRLRELGLVPDGSIADIARSTASLVPDSFFRAIADGRIRVLRDTTVRGFTAAGGHPHAELSDGSQIASDLVICATGWRQRVPFLDEKITARLTDDRGNFELYRQILPHDTPNLTFAGYNSSFFSSLSAEMSAVWIASYLDGQHQVPPVDERRRIVARQLRWMEQVTGGHHARGTSVIPFSMHNIDEMLDDLGLNVGKATKAMQWLLPVNPRSYRNVAKKLQARGPRKD